MSNNTTHLAAIALHVVNFGLTPFSPATITEPRGATSPPASFQVTAQGAFAQSVTLSCGFAPAISGASCGFAPAAVVYPTSSSPVNAAVTVTVPPGTAAGNYTVTVQASASGTTPLNESFAMIVTTNPTFIFSESSAFPNVKVGSTGTSGPITISSQDGFNGVVSLSCSTTFGTGSCSIAPTSIASYPATATLVINGTSFSAGAYQIAVQGNSGSINNSYPVQFNVGDYSITGTQAWSGAPGAQFTANLTLAPLDFYSGQINASCDATALSGTQCTLTPQNPITVGGASVPVTAAVNLPNNAIPGTYNININTQDVSGTPQHALTIAVTVNQDFTIGLLTPATQTISPGQSASYNFSVLPVGASFTGAVNLSCSGGPALSLCSFTPNPVTPGTSSAAVVMSITTTASSARLSRSHIFYAMWLALPGLALLGIRGRKNGRKVVLPACLSGLFVLALLLCSCGGGGSNGGSGGGGGGGQQQGTQPGTYTITVTGSSGAISHQASTVTLIVN